MFQTQSGILCKKDLDQYKNLLIQGRDMIMDKMTLKTVIRLVIVTLITCTSFSCVSDNSDKSEIFSVQISDKPLTFCNPITLNIGSERARRAGEPVVVLHQNDYYLFISGGRGYWYSDNMRDWTYVEAPDLPHHRAPSANVRPVSVHSAPRPVAIPTAASVVPSGGRAHFLAWRCSVP